MKKRKFGHIAGDSYTYTPIIKHRNFLPNPVAVNGIPLYADSSKDPKVVGTAAWEDWWTEQIYYCIHGYDTGRMYIPGRYYYYLNFFIMSTVGIGNHYPPYVDLDYEFFSLADEVKRRKYGIIAFKARRKGLTNKVSGIFDHGFRFRKGYKAGIVAGKEDYSIGFYNIFRTNASMKPAELSMSINFSKSYAVHKYNMKDANGQFREMGTFNEMFVETMFNNPGVLKGKFLDDCAFEEAGEFPLLKEGYGDTEPCFRVGNMLIGTPYVFGTGSNISSGSEAFIEMWNNPDPYRLIKFWVPGQRLYYPFIGGLGKTEFAKLGKERTPGLLHLKEYERVGVEDVENAEKDIVERGEEYKKLPDKKSYRNHMQSYPRNEREAMLRFSINDFPAEEIGDQLLRIESEQIKYNVYKLSFKKDERGELIQPLSVNAIPVSDDELANPDFIDNNRIIYVYRPPNREYAGLDIAGTDSYDIHKSNYSKSLGAMVIYRRKHTIPNLESELPIALVNFRPKFKEIFYDTCMMAAVWYGLEYNVLVDADKSVIMNHFEFHGCGHYLAERPKRFDAHDSQQVNELGVKLTAHSKPLMIGLIQTYFSYHSQKVFFPQILKEALDYDVVQKKSDWDTIDALGIALMRDADMGVVPFKKENDSKDMDLDFWTEDENGNLVRGNNREERKQGYINEKGEFVY